MSRFSAFIVAITIGFTPPTAEEINQLLDRTSAFPAPDRIEQISDRFLGAPYVLGALGEGTEDHYDSDPLYRFDSFDCTTFVETVMALSHARNLTEFQAMMLSIRYRDGEVSFFTRNHFPETDWVPNNILAGFLRDATREAASPHQTYEANTVISKRGWYSKLPITTVTAPGLTEQERRTRHAELQTTGMQFPDENASTPYLHLSTITADPTTLERIPLPSIINIIRPNWKLAGKIGTNLNVSHQALVFRKNGVITMRHASSAGKKVIDVPLATELSSYQGSPTIKGIQVLEPR
jgi:hypothetical protein